MKQRRLLHLFLITLGLIVLGCSPKQADQKTPADSPAKPDFSAMQKRELGPLPQQRIQSEDGYFQAEAEMKAPSTIRFFTNGSYYYIPLNIGTNAPLECYLYKHRVDMASLLVNTHGALTDQLKITRKELTLVNAAVFDNAPYLRADLAYLNDKKQYGNLKVVVSTKKNKSLLCLHNEIGYKDSFNRIVSGVVKSLTVNDGSFLDAYRLKSISTITLNSQRVGFVESFVVPKANGGISYYEYTGMLVPRSKEAVITIDKFVSEQADSKGILMSGNYVSSKNNEIDMNLNLRLNANDRYVVQGKFAGKDLQTMVQSGNALKARYPIFEEMKDHFHYKGKRNERAFFIYSPEMNPTATIQVKYRFLEKLEKNLLKIEESIGAIKTVNIIDDKASVSVNFPLGSTSMTMERVYFEDK